ncbi:lys-63-specific deubiquitinase BRCC36 [Cajanus cajan]|uniref:Lys-63-specific deubiquitinase BRCC36 n=1 Tax=Cajanus cajan TaxID=3821 RepID=A0A151SXP9_CAJCA|nr:lys-63-specific deubiquitinase BRCC36 [Cajanus cajan]KYP59592.1 Lys-63-specific deubiquitinase BRCC36 [Cajanus cajan]
MSLTSVKMSSEVWLSCVTHALSTETEEIMGLLLGDIQHSKNGSVTALIWGASPQTRSDRRKDRVETNPEQLAAASALAERMTSATGRTTRVIGWYHSHPHITVLPSHVDVRTQAMYQLLDSGFIGLIFSCYSEDVNKVGRIQVIAFQSSDGKQSSISRPVPLSPVNRSSVIDIDSSPSSSENVSVRSGYFKADGTEQDTGDSTSVGASKDGGRSDLGNFFANADANYLGRDKSGGNYHLNNLESNTVDVDPMDMSESMQEAMHRSNLEMSGAEYVRKEIPLHVLPAPSLINLDSPLSSYTDLQRVLFEEEQNAYNQAISQNMRDGKVHPLTFIHHTSTYQASLCKLIEYCLSPAINALQDRLRENEIRLAFLSEEAKSLEAEAYRGSEAGLGSPRQVASPVHRGGSSPGVRNLQGSPESLGSRSVASPSSRSRKGY